MTRVEVLKKRLREAEAERDELYGRTDRMYIRIDELRAELENLPTSKRSDYL